MTSHFIPPQGGYQTLLSYQKALAVYQATVHFCDRFIDKNPVATIRWCKPHALENKTYKI